MAKSLHAAPLEAPPRRAGTRRPATGLMKAVALDRFGPPSVLTARAMPMPEPGPGEILIALTAAGVGVWDADIRKGWWPKGRPPLPLVPGTDGAGVVVAKGAGVRRFEIGDRVWATRFASQNGFYAEYVAVDADQAGHVPERLDLLQAGAAAVTGLTALQGVDDHLRVRPGDHVLIFGATGAVGTLAVQFAKRLGARVIGTARGRSAGALLERLGADDVIDPDADDALARLRAAAPEGLDAVLALAGGEGLERCLDLLRPNGRLAFPNGVEPEPRPRPRIRRAAYDGEAGPRQFARLARAVDEARLRVPLAATFPLSQAARAHERLERGRVLGRIALRIRR